MHIPSSATIILLVAGLRFVFMFDVPFTPCRNIWQGPLYFSARETKPGLIARNVYRLTRLLALAVKCEGLVRSGAIPDYAELARRGWVTRARITQIMNLLHLASPIQEEILHWPD
jgi:hypothetical protein